MSARDLAASRIARAAAHFPDIGFRAPRSDEAGELEARDAALAAAIEHAVLRRWLTLVAVIEQHLSRPWVEVECKLQAVLLCGAAQLLLMDRLPDYAVIHESVEWAKTNVRSKAGGLVNAVLRKIASLRGERQPPAPGSVSWQRNQLPLPDGHVLHLNADTFAEDPLPRLSQQTSHPLELLQHWVKLFGRDRATRLAAHDLVHAPIILHNLDSGDAAKHSGLQLHEMPGFFVLGAHGHSPVQDILRQHSEAIVQDPTSASVAPATRSMQPAPRLIIDACAGRGTKTRQLALLHPSAEIIATDIDDERQQVLRETFTENPRVRIVEYRQLMEFAGRADLVLLDVPCSNTGVLARRVEAKYRFSSANLKSLIDVQRQIIANAIPLLNDHGSILYATCSVDPAENQQQVEWLMKWHAFRMSSSEKREPKGLPGENPSVYCDGGYWALLQRSA